MNGLSIKKLLVFVILISLASPVLPEVVTDEDNGSPCTNELNMSQISKKRKTKVKKPVSAEKAQKKQDAKEKKQDRDYEKYVKENRKRAQEIQTPAVKERMKQNVKDANANYKEKKKTEKTRTKKGAKKYRK